MAKTPMPSENIGDFYKKYRNGANGQWVKKRTRQKTVILKRSKNLIKTRKASKMSKGEERIAKFLFENNVRFIREYYHHHLFNYFHKKHLLFFDFYLPEYDAVIEFDGIYHFKGDRKQQSRDSIKNYYCKNKGIKILRIPYWKFKDIDNIITEWFDKNF